MGDILIERSGGSDTQPVGRVGLITEYMLNEDFAFANFIQRISVKKDILLPQYLYYCLQQMYEMGITASMQAQTTGIRNLDWKQYVKIILPQPPLSEQTTIAKILSTVDEAIRSTRETISKLERVKKSLMQNLLSGKMKPDGTLRPATEFYEDDKMGLVPKGWTVIRVKKCMKLKNGKANVTSNLKDFPDEKYHVPVFGGNGITGYYTAPLLNERTIIIGRVGEYCGNVFLTPEKSWVTDNAMIVDQFLIPNFNLEFFKLRLGTLNFKQWSDSTGQPKITQGGIGAIEFCFPESVEEQNLIAQKIASVQSSIDNKQEKITALESLKKSLMQQLLTGRVRVK